MEVIDLDQDGVDWLNERRKSVGGSDSKGFLPTTRKNSDGDYLSAGFWQYIGQQLTSPRDLGEAAMDRGHRLEEEAVKELETVVGLPFELKPGMWRNGNYHISSDGAEPVAEPTYDCEVKCLKEGKHFKYLYKARNWDGAQLDLIPDEYGAYYKEQALHGFVVNKKLRTRYFVLYEPNAKYAEHKIVVIVINRNEIVKDIELYESKLNESMQKAQAIISELIADNF